MANAKKAKKAKKVTATAPKNSTTDAADILREVASDPVARMTLEVSGDVVTYKTRVDSTRPVSDFLNELVSIDSPVHCTSHKHTI